MAAIPLIPETAPFSPEQRAWLNGFFSGLFSRPSSPQTSHLTSQTSCLRPLTILFGSQTGTAENLARKAAKEAGRRGFAATVLDMAQTDIAALAGGTNLLVIVSTYGDGEPPDSAKALHSALGAPAQSGVSEVESPRLTSVRFSVCALGDTNYTHFCQCGKDFDERLEKLGAVRVTPRTDCDLDHDGPFAKWLDGALAALGSGERAAGVVVADRSDRSASTDRSDRSEPGKASAAHSRASPFPALLLATRNLNAPGSGKQVHHVEFSLEGSGLVYEAGDALGVMPANCPDHVNEVLAAAGFDGEEAVQSPDGSTTSLRRALTELHDLGKPTPELLAMCGMSSAVAGGVDPGPRVSTNTAPMPPLHVIDALLSAPGVRHAPADFIRALKKLQPRLYSISSSPKANPGQVHLTVGSVRYEMANRPRKGVCSTFLADRTIPGETRAGVFVHINRAFRPPTNGETPMIMVGPGTGIAPFRAFLQDRQASGATGRSWLFFGDQRASTDFLYREELASLVSSGTLTRLDTAFSRDQPEKIYVQHRMKEHAAGIYDWLESGAHLYVCGDASRMAKDVDAALHEIVREAGGKSAEQAAAYVDALRTSKRYARDVY